MRSVLSTLRRVEPDARVVALLDPRAEALRAEFPSELGETASLRAGRARARCSPATDLDGVMVGTRCTLHAPYAAAVLARGLPLFLEKPIATSWDQLAELRAAGARARSQVVVSFPLRVSAICELAQQIVASGAIGTVEQVQAVNNPPAYAAGYYHGWMRDEEQTGGLWLQKATHDLDYLNYLVGQRPVQALRDGVEDRLHAATCRPGCAASTASGPTAPSEPARPPTGSAPSRPTPATTTRHLRRVPLGFDAGSDRRSRVAEGRSAGSHADSPSRARQLRNAWGHGVGYPSCSVLPCEAGWYAVLQVPAIMSEEALVLELLDRTGILVHPGYFFDFEREAFLVISLLPETAAFSSAAADAVPRDRPASMIRRSRRSGISVPLFSLRSSRSWGIGEIGDIPAAASWLRSACQSVLQILPLNELAPGEASPYSALSAMSIDPQFISIRMLEDGAVFEEICADDLEIVRRSPRIDYKRVRDLKNHALKTSFERFFETQWLLETNKAAALRAYMAREAWWLDEYSLYRALRAESGERPWVEWPADVRDRDATALTLARERLSKEILFFQYVQWIADDSVADRTAPD